MKLLKLIPAAAIAIASLGSLDAFADSNSKQTDTYSLYCGQNSGNKWYHSSSKSSDRHYHSCDRNNYKMSLPYAADISGSSGKAYHYCSSREGAYADGTCSKN